MEYLIDNTRRKQHGWHGPAASCARQMGTGAENRNCSSSYQKFDYFFPLISTPVVGLCSELKVENRPVTGITVCTLVTKLLVTSASFCRAHPSGSFPRRFTERTHRLAYRGTCPDCGFISYSKLFDAANYISFFKIVIRCFRAGCATEFIHAAQVVK